MATKTTKTTKTSKTSAEQEITLPDTVAKLRTLEPFNGLFENLPAMLEPNDIDYDVVDDMFILLAQIQDVEQEFSESGDTQYARMVGTMVAINRAWLDLFDKVAMDSDALRAWAHKFKPADLFERVVTLMNFYATNMGE